MYKLQPPDKIPSIEVKIKAWKPTINWGVLVADRVIVCSL